MVKDLPSKICILPLFQFYFEIPASPNACFPLLPTPYLHFKLYKISADRTSSWHFAACELTKYNGFQSGGKKSDETPYLMPLNIILKNKL